VLIRGDGDAERFHVPKRDTFAAHVPRYTQREREREREGGRESHLSPRLSDVPR